MATTTYAGAETGTTTRGPADTLGRLFIASEPATRALITSPEAAADALAPVLHGLDREGCAVAYLDTKHRVLGIELVSLGTVDHTFMAPRDIMRGALLANATAVVVAHNHPSGELEPSADDEHVTRRIVAAGEVVGVDVLDHLITSGDAWVSLARRGIV